MFSAVGTHFLVVPLSQLLFASVGTHSDVPLQLLLAALGLHAFPHLPFEAVGTHCGVPIHMLLASEGTHGFMLVGVLMHDLSINGLQVGFLGNGLPLMTQPVDSLHSMHLVAPESDSMQSWHLKFAHLVQT